MSDAHDGQIGAAIAIGSNSVHLLVAQADAGVDSDWRALSPLADQGELLGLGDGVDAVGEIGAPERDQVVSVVTRYRDLARDAGAQRMTVIGTEPLRRAANAQSLIEDVRAQAGLTLHVLSVEAEAMLTFVGVVGPRPSPQPLIVIDIGGGSTELGIHVPGRPFQVVALPIGSARLTRTFLKHDPPTAAEMERMHAAARSARIDLAALPAGLLGPGRKAVFVGGTATNLARLGRLTRVGLAADQRTLMGMSATSVGEQFGVRPRRARQLAAGAAIVATLLEQLAIDEALVSEASLRDGAIIADLRLGDEWPARLGELFDTGAA